MPAFAGILLNVISIEAALLIEDVFSMAWDCPSLTRTKRGVAVPELKDRAYWLEKAKTLRIEGRAFIDGVYVDAHSSATFWSYSPIDALPLAPVALCASADVALAVAAARRSFEVGVWSGLAPRERKAVLLKWAALLEAHTD